MFLFIIKFNVFKWIFYLNTWPTTIFCVLAEIWGRIIFYTKLTKIVVQVASYFCINYQVLIYKIFFSFYTASFNNSWYKILDFICSRCSKYNFKMFFNVFSCFTINWFKYNIRLSPYSSLRHRNYIHKKDMHLIFF